MLYVTFINNLFQAFLTWDYKSRKVFRKLFLLHCILVSITFYEQKAKSFSVMDFVAGPPISSKLWFESCKFPQRICVWAADAAGEVSEAVVEAIEPLEWRWVMNISSTG